MRLLLCKIGLFSPSIHERTTNLITITLNIYNTYRMFTGLKPFKQNYFLGNTKDIGKNSQIIFFCSENLKKRYLLLTMFFSWRSIPMVGMNFSMNDSSTYRFVNEDFPENNN